MTTSTRNQKSADIQQFIIDELEKYDCFFTGAEIHNLVKDDVFQQDITVTYVKTQLKSMAKNNMLAQQRLGTAFTYGRKGLEKQAEKQNAVNLESTVFDLVEKLASATAQIAELTKRADKQTELYQGIDKSLSKKIVDAHGDVCEVAGVVKKLSMKVASLSDSVASRLQKETMQRHDDGRRMAFDVSQLRKGLDHLLDKEGLQFDVFGNLSVKGAVPEEKTTQSSKGSSLYSGYINHDYHVTGATFRYVAAKPGNSRDIPVITNARVSQR